MRGSETVQTAGLADATATGGWITLFNGNANADGPSSAAGFEALSSNNDRVSVRFTTGDGKQQLLTVGPGGYKIFRAGKRQITKIEVRSPTAGQQFYFDLLGHESF